MAKSNKEQLQRGDLCARVGLCGPEMGAAPSTGLKSR